jgi:acyl transferase domain-containing protein/NADPH:quinone reductase-like Zn-dependent oxidoreductase
VSTPATRLGDLSALKLALMAKKVRAEAQAVLRADPIAIVGMACRAPGGADSPARFWDLLASGKDAIREVPPDRWDADAWFDPDPAAPAKIVTKWGGFLDQIDGFDAGYFGILPREAEQMDPQQRVFLEVAIEALDDAGVPRERLRGSRSGVFVASYQNDYSQMQYADLDAIDARTLTGTLHSVLANRLSYFLDLRGPSLSIDTACSSSLVAIHLACQSLRTGESDLALAGGVSLMITPALMVSLSKVGFMAPDGHCKTFDARADGFGRGEGCGVVVLKRLADAISDDDRILAVVRGSAVNQDGHSTLLAAPNGQAQQALIREALASAQLSPARIGFIEAHGTGTALGDPIEVEALAATVGKAAPGAGPCLLGAAKANVGHLEAAAGVIGVVKAVLALGHGAVPPQVGFTKLSPHIALEGTRLAVPRELTPWPRGPQPRCAAISSFGVGGTNAHVILEEPPELSPPQSTSTAGARLLTLSAQSPEALRAVVDTWLGFLSETTAPVDDICRTALDRRSQFDWRIAVVGDSREGLRGRLAERAGEGSGPLGRQATARPRVGLVFSGQGPQWFAMGRELLGGEAVFREVLTECDALLRPLSGWSLLEELAATETASRLDQTEVAQPALFALQVALGALWKSWGLEPDGVIGHSVGEIAALHVAGVLSLAEAVRVVWHRGRIMQEATGLGRMAQVSLPEDEARDVVKPFGPRLSVGAINGPRSVVLSGEGAALEAALATLGQRGVKHRMLPVQYAFHSAQMAPFQQRLVAALGQVPSAPPAVAFYSTVTGGLATGERFDGAYFSRNVGEPVRFEGAIGAMTGDGFDVFLEIGPHPVLSASISECLEARGHTASVGTSLRRTRPERETMLAACALLFESGWSPDAAALQPVGAMTPLPAYPWQRRRYWIRTRPTAPKGSTALHPLLGRRVEAAGIRARIFEGDSERAAGWLADHRVFGRLIMPGAGVLETLFAAARATLGEGAELTEFAMHQPLFLPEAGAASTAWQTVVTLTEPGAAELSLYEAIPAAVVPGAPAAEIEWRRIASASANPGVPTAMAFERDSTALEAIDLEAVYARFLSLGVDFGPSFRCLRDVRRGEGVAEGWIDLPAELESDAPLHAIHPVVLDAGLQLCSIAAPRGPAGDLPRDVFLPLGVDSLQIVRRAGGRVFGRARIGEAGSGSLSAEVTLEVHDGERVSPLVILRGIRFARADASAFAAHDGASDMLYERAWHPLGAASTVGSGRAEGAWLVFADRGGFADRVIQGLVATGGRCVRVLVGNEFAKTADDTWTVNPAEPEHLALLLADLLPADAGTALRGSPRGALHFWGLDVSPLDQEGAAADEEDAWVVGSVLHLVQGLTRDPSSAVCPLWLLSRGAEVVTGDEPVESLRPRAGGTRGIASVIALEHPELGVRQIDLDPRETGEPAVLALLAELLGANGADASSPRTTALRDQRWWTPRIERRRSPAAKAPEGPLRVELVRPGTLDGVELRPFAPPPLERGQVRLRVLATGINFRDVLMTLGMYPGKPVPLGLECAGIVTEVGAGVGQGVGELTPGVRAFGFAPGSLGTEVTVPAAFLAPVPEGLSAEDAAGIPVAFLTAYYGLHRLAGLAASQRVLIHAAAGGVGLAAVQLARRCGAEIFATAGSNAKRDMLRALGVEHVMDSRSLAFADEIRKVTAGEGVHVVLNSLAGDFIPASLGVVGQGGAFLELGKRDVMTAEQAARARPDVRYHLYDLGSEAQVDHTLLRPMFDAIMAGLAKGELRPLPVQVYPLERISDAFRFMAQARHIGKVVVRSRIAAIAAATSLVSASATYWITGGLGGIGLETARWLARSGARSLVLSGRREPSPAVGAAIRELERLGVSVRVFAADIGDRAQVQAIVDAVATTMPPLRGIIHAAGVVDDAVLLRQTWERCRGVLRGKAHGAWLLHELTRGLPLDFFVLYSAAGVLLGAPGQGPYAAANAELDALAQARRRLGLPALSVAWGAWADVGMAAALAARGPDVWAARGLGKITPATGFAGLERLMREGATYAAVMPIRWPRFLGQLAPGGDRAFFAAMGQDVTRRAQAPAALQGPGVVEVLRSLPSSQRRTRLLGHLSEQALHVIGLDTATAVNPTIPLKEIGLDSLMAVELRNTLARSLGQALQATLLFDYPTLDALADHLSRTLALEPDAQAGRPTSRPRSGSPATSGLAELSDQEAEALLLKELEEGSLRSTHGG